ncbi:MAG: hypothetical protein OXC91_10090, partial [Rhodobacteraceae bacterium]|nr:hypothetical protein [Paracoccaceae bacterium]
MTLDSTILLFDSADPLILFFACGLVLAIVSGLIGRLYGRTQLDDQGRNYEALRSVGEQKREENAELRRQHEEIINKGIRAQDSIDRWDRIRQDHASIEKMKRELDEFEKEESNRIDELERRRVEKARILSEIESRLASYPPELMADAGTWEGVMKEREEEYDSLREQIEAAQKEFTSVDNQCRQAGDEAARLESRSGRLKDEIESEQLRLKEIREGQADALEPAIQGLREEMSGLLREISGRRQELEEILALKRQNEVIEAVGGAKIEFPSDPIPVNVMEMPGEGHDHSLDKKLSSFRMRPACLDGLEGPLEDVDEEE